MKFATLLVALAACAIAQTKQEKQDLVKSLQDSLKTIEASLKGVSNEQFKFKAAPNRWSIAECAEHVALTEPFIRQTIANQVMKAPAPPKRMSKAEDSKLYDGIADRSKRASAPGEIAPKGVYTTPAEALKALRASRRDSIAWIKSNKDDMRAHWGESFKMDAYQYFTLIAAHTVRHTKQIEEVKQSANYPK